MTGIRVGIDVGGTFTDAVAVSAATYELLGQVKVPTSHHHRDGVAHGIVTALAELLARVGVPASAVSFLAHGTTQATNALLEGDVARIGVVGIGRGVDGWATGRLRSLRKLRLAPGRTLPVDYAALRDPAEADAAVGRLKAGGAEVLVAVEPFSVDDPAGERAVLAAAERAGLPATATHEISKLYGLTRRARTAVLNAGIMPRMLETATLVERAITEAGITAPLMVMRCDGGVMSLAEMRGRPLLTVLSGPAAGVAGALLAERVSDGVFLETGGTSTDISVIRRGRVQVRHAKLGGRETYLSSLDVRTVGVGGGSLLRFADGDLVDVGPRSAHIAGLPYACFARPEQLAGARLVTVRPRPEDPADYVALEAEGGRFAVTLTCAANALGLVPADDHARADPEAARLALAPLAQALGVPVPEAARRVLDRAVGHVRAVVDALVADYRLDRSVLVLVGGGGGAATVTPHLGAGAGLAWRIAAHSEVISPLGVALALVRESVERIVPNPSHADVLAVRAEAEQAVVAQGADPAGVEVDVSVDPQRNLVRAVATGATDLRTKDLASTVDEEAAREVAARSLGGPAVPLAHNGGYRVYGTPARRTWFRRRRHPVRVVDTDGVLRVHSPDAHVDTLTVAQAPTRLPDLVRARTRYGDGGGRAPALRLLLGTRIVDLSGVLDPDALLALADTELRSRPPGETLITIMEERR
ncbi:N-methylhydantoinase A/oxoprolinase/acetone carboxylase beta subunit [Crossiella equi]|uniref:N-methylhydantoinase A/oxoprolinase/acetone carboxylase beta subunit n=2 Tax=Crossiella equi TaxID=130796 RepID=A0ABS5ASE5_9PSEU|nr:hydantoinase/oxoprolinase family protein [Crossiella equi]MBP2479490.1 N-methylhydantoinase A/oxoprolinase/acetone carboxylase beta subunit [Crossiella equi]